jgi:hypothetical protein
MVKRAQYVLKLRLRGPRVRPGAIAVPDLIKICQAVQETVNRQAEALRGGPSRHPGPRAQAILDECTLELTGVRKGSTILPFRFAHAQQALCAPGHLGLEAVRVVAHTISSAPGEEPDIPEGVDPGVLSSLCDLSQALDGAEEIDWIVPAVSGQKRLQAVLTREVAARLRARPDKSLVRPILVEGTLEMADFRPSDQRCRIRPAFGPPIPCTFSPLQAETVYAALRRPVRAAGHAKIDPNTDRPIELSLESLAVAAPNQLGAIAFFQPQTLDQLAAAQHVGPITDPAALAGGWPEDENLDEFLEQIYLERHA